MIRSTTLLFQAITLLLALVLPGAGCSKYDELVDKDATCDQRWADLEASLQRR